MRDSIPPPPAAAAPGGVPWQTLVEGLLEVAVDVLARRPDLALKVRDALGINQTLDAAPAVPLFMSVAAYARHRCVSERTVRYMVKSMKEGIHYHRDGARGRRVILHVSAADKWRAERERPCTSERTIEELTVDEVTRRRARAVLKQVKGAR